MAASEPEPPMPDTAPLPDRRDTDRRPARTIHEDIRDRRSSYAICAFENLGSITTDEAALKRIRRLWSYLYDLGACPGPHDSQLITFLNEQCIGAAPRAANDAPVGTQVTDILRNALTSAGVKWHQHANDWNCIVTAQAYRCVRLGLLQWPGQMSMRSWKIIGASDWWAAPADRVHALIQNTGFDIRRRQAEKAAELSKIKEESSACR